ncbi:hypothetical protein BDV32DRAFT_159423 [Aspergillus pseudonomiae]|uniref:Uncharacterized protein n=1 Tax=Aspergillus pseudonomiae TaxID=1506151 RepID=A0A5N6HXP5_9EURO|nr:uncharacterized protein BDV37DRAFT_282516 [Aspergillus pseudonomiae]KAB8259176.1 hypothetical protein BDV32DRAFT_159423 [Aspergillus pseudonomiae]KAE8404714.1 hypothetical protein BDV37DRAFT_282516 [Aspergillus pseudonomiae]
MSGYFEPTALIPDPLSFHQERNSWEMNRYRSPEDGYFTESEEEVLYGLDEVAMAALPLRLQENMRELHLERVQRLKREESNTPFYKPSYHATSPVIWYKDSIAAMEASQDTEKSDRGGLPSSSPEQADWYLWQRIREMNERRHMEYDTIAMAGHYSHSSNARFNLGNNLFSKHSTSTEEAIETEYTSDQQTRDKYISQLTDTKARTCVVHTVEDIEAPHEGSNVHERVRQRGSSMISAMRGRMRKSIQRMSRVFKKQPSFRSHNRACETFVSS